MITLSRPEAARLLVNHVGFGLDGNWEGADAAAVLRRLRCVQMDPLDPIGTNQDLVVGARVEGVQRHGLYAQMFAAGAFEHFAKERCLLPATAFPYYRERLADAHWWRLTERLKRLPEGIVRDVLTEIVERGPTSASDLSDRGRVAPIDWSGWKGTSKAGTMALEVLWNRCEIVVCGRRGREKVYDIPERALGHWATAPAKGGFERWGLLERVQAAGMLSRAGGPQWSMLGAARTSGLVEELMEEGLLIQVVVAGSRRPYIASPEFLERSGGPDEGMRILGPLDPLIWDRKLVQHAFGFAYVWEVYKPAAKRQYGWYVHPLLHRGHLVGRIEAAIEDGSLRVKNVWEERAGSVDRGALRRCATRQAALCGASVATLPRRFHSAGA
jgi:uncharacterized protein